MSEISPELQEKVLSAFHSVEGDMLRDIRAGKWHTRYVNSPLYVDGVFDSVVFDRQLDKFTQIRVRVAKSGISTGVMLPDGAVFCDEYETIVIELP